MTKLTKLRACPCDSGQAYDRCCGPLHKGQLARDAEALMRSRYSAYVVGDINYVSETWHASTRPADLQLDANAKWLGLTIKDFQKLSANEAEVEFIARYRAGGQGAVRLHERSRFVLEQGRWYYLDGQFKSQ